MQNVNQTNKEGMLLLTREFNAPRSLVFKTFSEAKHLSQWWGPAGYKTTSISLDFKPGGLYHFKMEAPEHTMWARFIYQQIKKPELIEFILSFSDEQAGLTRAPFFDGSWPLEIHNSISLTEKNGKTTVTLTMKPVNATEQEMATFVKESSSYSQGSKNSLDQLEHLLAQLQR